MSCMHVNGYDVGILYKQCRDIFYFEMAMNVTLVKSRYLAVHWPKTMNVQYDPHVSEIFTVCVPQILGVWIYVTVVFHVNMIFPLKGRANVECVIWLGVVRSEKKRSKDLVQDGLWAPRHVWCGWPQLVEVTLSRSQSCPEEQSRVKMTPGCGRP